MATVIDFKKAQVAAKFERDLAAVNGKTLAKKLARASRSKATQRAQRAMAVRVAAGAAL